MAIDKFTKNMDIIAALDNEPNDTGGLTAEQLKEKFDEGGKAIKEYLNETVAPAIDRQEADAAALKEVKHTHSNKSLLDTYDQTEENLADAVAKKHSHHNKAVLDGIAAVTQELGAAADRVPSEAAVSEAISKSGNLPGGGVAGQVLAKKSDAAYDMQWDTLNYERVGAAPAAASVPVGGIILWSGSASAIPAHWALCNGQNGTPDLRGRFIVGAGGSYSPGATGGAETVTLGISQIPSHTHTATPTVSTGAGSLTTASNGAHTHYAQCKAYGEAKWSYPDWGRMASGSDGETGGIQYDRSNTEAEKTFRILSSGAHAHTISGAPSVSVSVSNANTGGGGAHENRPPYYALCYIMRIS